MEVNELEVGQSKKVLNSDSFPELKSNCCMLNLQSLESVLRYHGINIFSKIPWGAFAIKASPPHVMMANTLPSNRKKKMYPTATYLHLVKIFFFSARQSNKSNKLSLWNSLRKISTFGGDRLMSVTETLAL